MLSWGQNYNPSQMLDLCRVDCFDYSGQKIDNCVQVILATIVKAKDESTLIEQLKTVLRQYGCVSTATSLDSLVRVANIGPELEHGRTGLDALTYHMNLGTVDKALEALTKLRNHMLALDKEEKERRERESAEFRKAREGTNAS